MRPQNLLVLVFSVATATPANPAVVNGTISMPIPSAEQLHYMDNELTMFIHFSVCTFNDGCNGRQQNCGYHGKSNQPYPASS